jgi:Uma2 family endonuclease
MVPGSATAVPSPGVYPETDGKPMANNTEQLRWIVVLFGNLCAVYRDEADIFIGADLLWYPVEGQPEVCQAPDVFAVFGRPKGRRSSYVQWQEGNVPITVVFEILSPGNTAEEMIDKHAFYEDHGVEEYYVYNPDTNRLHVYVRKGELLVRRRFTREFVSPRLKVRFDLTGPEMVIHYPDGRRFLSFEEVETARVLAEQRAGQEAQRADTEAQRADTEAQRANVAVQRARRLAELSRRARLGQASPEELTELERIELDLNS